MSVVTNKKLFAPLFIVLALKFYIVTGLDNNLGKSNNYNHNDHHYGYTNDANGDDHHYLKKTSQVESRLSLDTGLSFNQLNRLQRRSIAVADTTKLDGEEKHNYHGDSISLDTLDGSNNSSKKQIDPIQLSQSGNGDIDQTRRKRRSRQNLCEHLCSCDLETKFVTVNCSFLLDKEYILGEHYSVPNTTRRLRINLADRTALRLDEGFFKHNNVNSVLISGLVGDGGQIEITKHAFSQNLAVYPEIVINRCSKLILKENAFRGEFILNVSNCRDVFITKNAFHNTTFTATFDTIKHMGLFDGAFSGSMDSKVEIINANLEELGEIGASMKVFSIINSTVGRINRQAFSVVSIDSLVFENSKIDVIDGGSVAEKLYCRYLAVINCKIDVIKSRAIDGSGIMTFILERNRINTIEADAFFGTAVVTEITSNNIISVGSRWLSVADWSNIIVKNNTFGEFHPIQAGKTSNPGSCLFSQNFITSPAPNSLNFNHSSCQFTEISFYEQCSCSTAWLKKLTTQNLESETYCQVDKLLKHCFNSTTFNVARFLNQVCDPKSKELDCLKNMNVKKVEGSFISPEQIRQNTTKYILIAAVCISVLLCILVVLVIYFACKRCCGKKEEQETFLLRSAATTLKRTKPFSDDDRRIIINTLDTMKLTETHALYNRVYQHTKKLLDGGLDEAEKVICIGEIVRALNECEHSAVDYIAFTDILYKQLRPEESAPPEYEVEDPNNGAISMVTNIDGVRPHNEHIYAEPICVRKPLLNNDYSLPVDRDGEEPLPVYSEPIRKIITSEHPSTLPPSGPKMATPYAIGSATNVVQFVPQQTTFLTLPTPSTSPKMPQDVPSHSQNLPDILYQSISQATTCPPVKVLQLSPTASPSTAEVHSQRV